MKRLRKRSTRAAGFMLGLFVLAMWMIIMAGGAMRVATASPGPKPEINSATASVLPIITVMNTNDSGPGSLRQAIADAAPGDTINFSVTGTITLTSGQLDINKNLTILGPGAASLTISGNNASRVFMIGSGGSLTISDLTISNGRVSDFGNGGGGIFNNGTLTVTNSTLSNNSAEFSFFGGGGGIDNRGTLTVTNSTLSNNSAFDGGGIENAGVATIINNTLSNNSAGRNGGGIDNLSIMTITDSTLSNNSANGSSIFVSSGGGICNSIGALMTITNSTLSNNSANGSSIFGGLGGGILNSGGATISNSTLSGNSAQSGGGIENLGTVIIINSTVSNNSANGLSIVGGSGGGIVNLGGATISNSTLSGNSATGNFANGGGIYNGLFAEIAIKNSMVANSPSGGDCAGGFGAFNALGVNFSTDGSCPGFTQVTPAQLNLAPLQVNPPGTTATHALLSGSVAIDAVIDCTDTSGIPVITDQRGVARPMDGDGNGIAQCDVGSYEAAACTSGDSIPPSITCPQNVTAATGQTCPPPTGVIVNFATPSVAAGTVSDNCPGVTVMCTPASGSTFPVGTTTVTCTATDAGGNTTTCSFTVTAFNACLQDDARPNNVVLFNTFTGEYRYCCGATVRLAGRGSVIQQGCVFTLQHNAPDRRLFAKIDFTARRGNASLQNFSGPGCTISDTNIRNNSCQCAAP